MLTAPERILRNVQHARLTVLSIAAEYRERQQPALELAYLLRATQYDRLVVAAARRVAAGRGE